MDEKPKNSASADGPLALADSRSSLFDKVPTEILKKLDQAIIDRKPTSYKAAFEQFDLASHGVSYSAFYVYARRLRAVATIHQTAELAVGPTPHESIPDLFAQQLLGALLDDSASPRDLHRLVDTYHSVYKAMLLRLKYSKELALRKPVDQETRAALLGGLSKINQMFEQQDQRRAELLANK